MKYIVFVILFIAVHTVSAQQTQTRNYIISRTFKNAGADVNDVSKVVTQVRYIDGLGRPLQNVIAGQSPDGTDIATPVAYDGAGRNPRQYLPYVATGNGSYKSTATADVDSWYLANSAGLQATATTTQDLSRPYSETIFEPSPLSRPSTQQAPGTRSRSGSVKYKVNTGTEVKRYDYNPATNTITSPGDYAAGALIRTQYLDDQDQETNEYTDMLGLVVCKSITAVKQAGATAAVILYTYYVYDDLGLLRAVLQPNYQDDGSLTNSAFLYDYDSQGRIIKKQIPGAGSTEYVYSKFDQPVLSRDANQTARNVWAFTKFDELNRPVMTGEISSGKTRAEWQIKYDLVTVRHENNQATTGLGYTLNLTSVATAAGFPQIADTDVLTVTYYDNYSFPGAQAFSGVAGYPAPTAGTVKSLVTGGRVRMLPGTSVTAGNWLVNTSYYDVEYRPVQTIRELYDLGAGPIERVSTKYLYDLAAVVAEQKTEQLVGGAAHSHLAVNSYDHADRLLSVKETVAVGGKTKTAYTLAQRYNILGQLQSKWFHGYSTKASDYRRRTDYTNNMRGWLTDAKTWYQQNAGTDLPFYAFNLTYNNVLYAQQYSNGNINSMQWLNKGETGFSAGLSFTYDGANRLLGSAGLNSYADKEDNIKYDKNGNILTLKRYGNVVDDLTYSYTGTGNRLKTINDASTNNTGIKTGTLGNYFYDPNGNMTYDINRLATISYNYLNLPKTVTIGTKILAYDYDAGGNKHKYVADTLTVKYAGIFEYDAANTFKRVTTSSGQVQMAKVLPSPASDTLKFSYFLQDHLGNVRVVFDEAGKILQLSDYYPFGGVISRDGTLPANARNGVNRYQFNGKETQIGSGYIDITKRFYDPMLARFLSTDVLADKYAHNGTYNYAENRPIDGIDLDGLEFYRTVDKSGTITIGANVKFENSSKASEQRVVEIKRNIQSTFNEVIGSANNSYRGQVDYDDNATLTVGVIDKGEDNAAGVGGKGVAITTNNDFKNGNIIDKSVGTVANGAVHELLHNAGLGHPTDVYRDGNGKTVSNNKILDTELKTTDNGNGTFSLTTTGNTAKNIYSNIMIYGTAVINGLLMKDVRKKPENANTITAGQLQVILNNINGGKVNGEASEEQ
ncbi:DUF6443 domain-containing protein [Dyadobacter sp. NIV53]|uniref:DUF6443 domain-containing protein n=1 Tax=Dyadobacter sp. NIV53 TaxID=2861765 RepID=UPI001C886723|nr:DUF6443 domain-containing protein [Dyadobacter sp. NIV53]